MAAIPPNSLVLVTGVNGYIASHVADQLLEAGYRVRGTTRSLSKIESLAKFWEGKFGKGKVGFVEVKDMSHDGAFDEAIEGVSGVAHVASNTTFNPDPNKVIPEVLAGLNGIFTSAAREPSVKRFVYTSSSQAATDPIPNKEFTIDSNTWHDSCIEEAWAPPPYADERKWAVYAASKTEAEKALWKFAKEQKPGFVVNSILPNANFGTILAGGPAVTTAMWVKSLYDGDVEHVKGIPPQWFVDVQDCARLHVAALINPDVQNERIYAFAEPFNFNDILRALRKLRPNQKFPADFVDDDVRDLSKVDNGRAVELLKAMGRPGFSSMVDSIDRQIQGQ